MAFKSSKTKRIDRKKVFQNKKQKIAKLQFLPKSAGLKKATTRESPIDPKRTPNRILNIQTFNLNEHPTPHRPPQMTL